MRVQGVSAPPVPLAPFLARRAHLALGKFRKAPKTLATKKKGSFAQGFEANIQTLLSDSS